MSQTRRSFFGSLAAFVAAPLAWRPKFILGGQRAAKTLSSATATTASTVAELLPPTAVIWQGSLERVVDLAGAFPEVHEIIVGESYFSGGPPDFRDGHLLVRGERYDFAGYDITNRRVRFRRAASSSAQTNLRCVPRVADV